MNWFSALAPALLYTGLALAANPASAQSLSQAERAELADLRTGDLRKLVIHDAPVPVAEASFTDRDGNPLTLGESDGQVRLVNFWATWCAPCRQEKPALDALQKARGGADFAVIAIATGRNSLEGIDDFNADVGVDALATYLDPRSTVAAAMKVPGLPVTVLLNREGEEIGRLLGGADWSADSARAIVDYLVALPG